MAGRIGSCWGDGEMTDLLGFGGFGGSRSKKRMDSFLMFLAAMSEGCARWLMGTGQSQAEMGPTWDEGRRVQNEILAPGSPSGSPRERAWHWPRLAFGPGWLAKIGLCIRRFQIGRDLCAQYEFLRACTVSGGLGAKSAEARHAWPASSSVRPRPAGFAT